MSRTARTVTLLVHLLDHGAVTTSQAAAMLGVASRLARRDLDGLRTIGLVRKDGTGRGSRWVVDGERGLAVLDRISLLVGREVTGFLAGTSLHRGMDRLREIHGVGDVIPGRIRFLPEPGRDYAPSDEIVDACLDGLIRTRTLALEYEKRRGHLDAYPTLQPLTLVVYRRALYVVGRLGGRAYAFAVDRMRAVTVGEPFEYPTDWDVDDWLAGRFGIAAGDEEPMDVVLRFSAKVAHLVRARQWHATQTLADLPDGQVLLVMRTMGMELVRFVLEWGEHCHVLAPAELREQVVSELRNALATYGREP